VAVAPHLEVNESISRAKKSKILDNFRRPTALVPVSGIRDPRWFVSFLALSGLHPNCYHDSRTARYIDRIKTMALQQNGNNNGKFKYKCSLRAIQPPRIRMLILVSSQVAQNAQSEIF